jgi:hypothetical protein
VFLEDSENECCLIQKNRGRKCIGVGFLEVEGDEGGLGYGGFVVVEGGGSKLLWMKMS